MDIQIIEEKFADLVDPRFHSNAQGLFEELTAYTPKSVMPLRLAP